MLITLITPMTQPLCDTEVLPPPARRSPVVLSVRLRRTSGSKHRNLRKSQRPMAPVPTSKCKLCVDGHSCTRLMQPHALCHSQKAI